MPISAEQILDSLCRWVQNDSGITGYAAARCALREERQHRRGWRPMGTTMESQFENIALRVPAKRFENWEHYMREAPEYSIGLEVIDDAPGHRGHYVHFDHHFGVIREVTMPTKTSASPPSSLSTMSCLNAPREHLCCDGSSSTTIRLTSVGAYTRSTLTSWSRTISHGCSSRTGSSGYAGRRKETKRLLRKPFGRSATACWIFLRGGPALRRLLRSPRSCTPRPTTS
jgi:hypothetical protein